MSTKLESNFLISQTIKNIQKLKYFNDMTKVINWTILANIEKKQWNRNQISSMIKRKFWIPISNFQFFFTNFQTV